MHVLVTRRSGTREARRRSWSRCRARCGRPEGRAAIARRAGAVTDVFRPGDRLPGEVEAIPTARATEVVFWIPGDRARSCRETSSSGRRGRDPHVPGVVPQGRGTPSSPLRFDLARARRRAGRRLRRACARWRARCARGRPGRLGEACSALQCGPVHLALDRRRHPRPRRARRRLRLPATLVRLRNEAGTRWANIDVQLQRRTDLIPNLVEAVRAYAAHERSVFEVTRACGAAAGRHARNGRPRRGSARRSAGSSRSPRPTPSSGPPSFLRLQEDRRTPRTRSAPRAATTTPRSCTSTRRCRPSRGSCWRAARVPGARVLLGRGDTAPPQVSFAS